MSTQAATNMGIDRITIQQIAANALTLTERLQWPLQARRALPAAISAQLNASPQLTALALRLHPTIDNVEALLFDIEPSFLSPLPTWAHPLHTLLSTFCSSTATAANCPDSDAMFADVFAPLLEYANAGLVISDHDTKNDHTDAQQELAVILQAARRYLQQRLLHLSGRVLATAFNQFKQTTDPEPERYQAFINKLRAGAIVDLLLRYPVLARVWLTEIHSWQTTTARFVTHFRDDRRELMLHYPRCAASLATLTFGLSDPHLEGRTVCRAIFSNGFSLAYKPRSVAIEVAYAALMQHLDQMLTQTDESIVPGAVQLETFDRGDHGWVAWISHEPCHDPAALIRYYHRFGQILAFNQLLGIGDIHPENLVAHGEFPIQVDVEVAFRAPLAQQVLPNSDGCAATLLDSVLFTNMVPIWSEVTPGIARDDSGWQRESNAAAQVMQYRWHGVGTDQITLKPDPRPIELSHLPVLNDAAVMPAAYLGNILNGMDSVHTALIQNNTHKQRLAEAIDKHCTDLSIRFVFRDTSQYTKLLERLTSPSCHVSGLTRSQAIAVLAGALTHAKNATATTLSHFVASECAAIEVNEVPYFECQTDATWVDARGVKLQDMFTESGLVHAQTRIREWSALSARRETDFVLTAYAGRFSKSTASLVPVVPVVPLIAMRECRVIDASADALSVLAMESARIEALLLNTSLESDDGSKGWISTRAVGTTDRLQLHALEPGLYDGLAGIALFLAMRLRRTNVAQTRTLLQGVLLNLQKQLTTTPLTAGWGTGVGGIAYVLAYVQSINDDPIAAALLAQLPDRAPTYPTDMTVANYDLLDGAAGLIAGFSLAWQRTQHPALLHMAHQWGIGLLEQFDVVFDLLEQAHGVSVAHGTDGMRVALVRLAQALADNGNAAASARFETAATKMAECIDTVTARRGDGSWCHGHAGWLATRHGSSMSLRSCVHTYTGQPPTQLCCGELGRIDALMTANPSKAELDALISRLAELVRRAARDGAYAFYLQAPQSLLPGLFTGLTGVGYLCERLLQAHEGQSSLGPTSPCVTGIV